MADNVSIVLTMKTDIDAKLKSIASTSRSCSKEFEEFQRRATELGGKFEALNTRYEGFNKKAAEAATRAETLKLEMSAMTKAARASGEELDQVSFQKLKREYREAADSAKGYASAAKDTLKEMKLIEDEVQKMEFKEPSIGKTSFANYSFSKNPAPSFSDGAHHILSGTFQNNGIGHAGEAAGLPLNGVSDESVIKKIGTAGLFKMAGDAVSQFAGFALESTIGKPIADLASGIASGAASGAAIGSIVPGIGTALGAVAGAGLGMVNGFTQIAGEQDDAFKDYYRSLYEDANAATAERLSSGSTLAAGRETTKLSFNTLLGDDKKAGAFLEQVQDTANTTPFLYDDLVGISKTMLSFGTAVDDIIPTLTKVGDAGAALGLSTGDIGTVATYLGRMQSSDKATLEYLNPLNERGFSVFQWLADDQGVSVGEVYGQISKGELSGSYVSDVILTQFEKLYAGMMDIQSKSTEGLDSTLQGLKENVDAAGGDAYNEARKESKEADIAAYGGALGDKLAELSAIGGEVQAYGENLKDQYQREALEAVLTGDLNKKTTVFAPEDAEKLEGLRVQFVEASQAYENGSLEAGQKMVDLREEAEALATAAYESSEWAQKQVDMQINQIDATRELTAAMVSATDAWRTNNAFSKGGAAGANFTVTTTVDEKTGMIFYTDKYGQSVDPMLVDVGGSSGWAGAGKGRKNRPGYAYGLDYVPYDEFPALLHQGERVLTAAEARGADRRNGDVRITLTGNEFHVREDSDVDAIAETLAQKLQAAMLRGGG